MLTCRNSTCQAFSARVRHSIHCNAEWRADWVCPVVRCSGSGDGWWEETRVRGIDQSLANASQLGKGFLGTKLVRALVELLFNDPEVTKIQTDPSPSNCERSDATRKRGLIRYRNHPRWSSRVHGSNTPGIRANTQCCLTLPSRDVKGWRPWPPLMSNVKHHEGSGDRRSIDSTIRGVGVIERHLEPTLLAVHLYGSAVDGGLKPHSDIDLLVTVTVRLDETTRRALINDLLETSASLERARFSAL